MGRTPVANSNEHLLSVLDTLEQCRAALTWHGCPDTAQLVSVAILELRMKLNRISDAELRALCEEMLAPDEAVQETESAASRPAAEPPRAFLRLVK
jgi:hypothetical protein